MALSIPSNPWTAAGIKVDDPRAISLLWLWLTQQNEELQDLPSAPEEIQATLASCLSGNKYDIAHFKNNLLDKIIHIDHLDWISDSPRQFTWIENYIKNHAQSSRALNEGPFPKPQVYPRDKPHNLRGKDLSIAFIDYWLTNSLKHMGNMVEHCNTLKIEWERLIESDRFFMWLKGDDSERKMETLWKHLQSKEHHITDGHRRFQTYEEVLVFFDNSGLNKHLKNFHSKNAKNLWNQQQRRDNNKDKKQCNFVLPKTTISKLEKLSKDHGLNHTKIIALLIELEFKEKKYISQWLNKIKLLKTPLE